MNDWFKEWFSSELYLEVYHKRNLQDAGKFLNTLLQTIQLRQGDKVLDAACGAGRYSYLLAEKGFDVYGFDLSKSLLKIANQNAFEFSIPQKFVCADIRRFCSRVRFKAVFNLFTSFGYFNSDEDNFAFVKNSVNFISEGGYFVIDFLNSNYVIKNIIPESKQNLNGKVIIEKRSVKKERVEKEIVISENENSQKFIESVALYSSEKIITKFEEYGFCIVKLLGDYSGNNFNKDNSERFIGIFKLC